MSYLYLITFYFNESLVVLFIMAFDYTFDTDSFFALIEDGLDYFVGIPCVV